MDVRIVRIVHIGQADEMMMSVSTRNHQPIQAQALYKRLSGMGEVGEASKQESGSELDGVRASMCR